MTVLEEAKHVVTKLSPAERVKLLGWLSGESVEIARGIFSTPGIADGTACVQRTRIPVWLLEAMRREGRSEADLLESYPHLTQSDLANAWAYVAVHREEIDRQIEDNDRDEEV